ncbi:MAG: molecular chaperone TorD family protein [Desulfobulbaceae bacterium]|nr:molecular chaperone TorD family protein [Desulfobulbaceae bacterium]
MNSELPDKQLSRVRRRFLDLLKSFFVDEPDAEKMSRWRGTFAALGREKINPALDNAIQKLTIMLSDKSLQNIQDEYYQLFVNPYGENQVETTVSSYMDGHNYGPSLAELRGFLIEAELEKDKKFTESEDSLVVMLDALGTLIEDENESPEVARRHQDTLLNRFLEPFALQFSQALKENKEADFYAACGAFLSGYLDLEKGLTGNAGLK